MEHYDAGEKAAAAKLTPAKDPVAEEINAFRQETRQDFNNRRFANLEKRVAELRREKSVFDNGSWKLFQFYDCFGCSDKEPETMWELHDRIHRDWIAQFPESITARVAYADFFTDYAWHARGTAYSDKVTAEGWRLFEERLASGRKELTEARALSEKDPMWWRVALHVALGQEWSRNEFDQLVEEAKSFEPKFWGYDTVRAQSLLPRWYGEAGDWEAYAEQAAARPDGLGPEVYARVVIFQRGRYDNIFRETKASWPMTRQGLEQMRQKYPRSVEIISHTAMLAAMAEDRDLAKQMFDQLGERYLPEIWKKPERFVHYRKWAETGQW